MMRLLLLERCELMGWLIDRLVPEGVEVERVGTFAEVRTKLGESDLQAAIFDLTPCTGPWEELAALCEEATPPIPFRWTSADESLIQQAGLPENQIDRFLCRPLPVEALRWELKALLGEVKEQRSTAGRSPEIAES